ncbi:MAG: PLP-dependent aspartate aminotransferase family protein, partial [Rhodoglobus sp.]
MATDDVHPESLTAQGLGWVDQVTRAISPPMHLSSTYLRDADNGYSSGRVYMRDHNPAFDQAEALITELEHGHQTLLFASGMATATAVFQALNPGDHVLAPKVMYWSLRNWLTGFAKSWGLDVELLDMTDPKAVQNAIKPGRTKLIWVETPANPLWTITDIAATAEIAHRAGALLAVDSTPATPVLTQPLDLGADLVMHSATKYLNGHSDLTAGSVTTRGDNEHWQRLRSVRAQIGGTLGSMESWLLLRGMRTLFLRVRTASASALHIAERFDADPRVSEVLYPGLPGAQGHEIAQRQMDGGFGGMLSIRVAGGEEAAIRVAARTRLWKRATSLGGVE